MREDKSGEENILERLCAGVIKTVKEGERIRLLKTNRAFLEMTGYTCEELRERFGDDYLAMIDERDRSQALEAYCHAWERRRLLYRLTCKDGGLLWVTDCIGTDCIGTDCIGTDCIGTDTIGLNAGGADVARVNGGDRATDGAPQADGALSQGTGTGRLSVLTDITEFMEQTEQLQQSEQLFRITNYASGGAVFDYSFATGTYLHFENAERIYRIPAEQVIANTNSFAALSPEKAREAMIRYFYHPDDYDMVAEKFERLDEEHVVEYVARSRRPDETYVWSQVHLALIFDKEGHPVRRVGHILDIDKMIHQMEDLKSQAQADPLTGLYNKMAATAIVDAVLKKENDKLSVLMVLDIDNFKQVNDTFGHSMGDRVLTDVCAKLKGAFDGQILGRVGGDEFIVFSSDFSSMEQAMEKAEEICGLFRYTGIGPREDYSISCSIGIAVCRNGENFAELFDQADSALYEAKRRGRNRYCLYEKETGCGR